MRRVVQRVGLAGGAKHGFAHADRLALFINFRGRVCDASLPLIDDVAAMIDFTRNHFELLGLPARYRIDEAALERAYRDLQSTVHPDRYAAASESDKRLALQASARVNEAYRTLRDPVARAEYLLALRGVDAAAEADTRLPVAFLARQLERREEAEEAGDAHDVARIAAVVDGVRADATGTASEVERALDANDDTRARERVRELRFLVKLAEDIEALGVAGIDE